MTTDETTGSKNLKIEVISQKDYDNMNGARKIMYTDLIKKGQVKISDGKEKKESPKEKPRGEGRGPFTWLRGKNVMVTMVTGAVLTGLLTDVWQYEICVDIPGSGPVLILKHALIMVQESPKGVHDGTRFP